jgi:carbamoyltransferase
VIKRFARPQSLGLFYSLITQYCGFSKDSEEYKLMGLAAFGDRKRFDFSWLLDFSEGSFQLDTDFIEVPAPNAPSLHRDEMNFTRKFIERMGCDRRISGSLITQFYKDVAASAQRRLEESLLHLIEFYTKELSIRDVCLSGGVALNCLANQKIMNAEFVNRLFVQPASSDAGISMGAAWLAALEKGIRPIAPDNAFLGNEFGNEEISRLLDLCMVTYTREKNIVDLAAADLAAGKVIGWYQGRMEFGPRALGNRSILASPCLPEMQQKVNQKIKFRESFRPFGASVIEEDITLFFEGKPLQAPYMTLVYDVSPDAKKRIPAVVHADGTCRIQTVSKADNMLYHNLLSAFKKLSGCGVLLNTSFNLNHEPIVNTPREAVASFYSSGLDVLYIGECRISK